MSYTEMARNVVNAIARHDLTTTDIVYAMTRRAYKLMCKYLQLKPL